tara:strand:- start:2840 stop:3805 length:966 start_codon:yes stop_codon:yes gene_type:complete
MLRNQESAQLSTYFIVLISMLFALFVGSGLYGYGNDFYEAYQTHNSTWGGTFDRLGWILSTLSINGVHIGVHIVTFLLSLSAGFLIREHLKFKDSYSLFFFISLYLIAIHTWPIIMSTSNAMRQGLAMSFIFMALIASSRKNYYWMMLLSLLAIFMHKTGLIFLMIVVFSVIMNNLTTNFSHTKKVTINFLVGVFLLIASNFSLGLIGFAFSGESSRIIGGDFRWAFVSISFIYVASSIFNKNILSNSFNLSLYYFSFISLSFMMTGLNWQYERMGMMMIIPYILSFGILLNRPSYKIYLILSFLGLLWATIFMGMYASLK